MSDFDLHRVVVAGLVYRLRKSGLPANPTAEDYMNAPIEYLIMRRPETAKHFKNIWCAPGGGLERSDIEAGEDVLERALFREMREEAGIDLEFERPWRLCHRGFVRDDGVGVVVFTYVAQWRAGDATLTPEAAEFSWVTAIEAKDYDLIGATLTEIQQAEAMLQEAF